MKPPPTPLTARPAAVRVLSDLRAGRRSARSGIDELVRRCHLPAREAALATELVMGVARHRLTLEHLLGRCSHVRWPSIGQQVQHILLVGGYQLIWLDGVPEFAAIHSAVEQAKDLGGAGSARFVNAVLRQLQRLIEERRCPAAGGSPARSVPVESTTVCLLNQDVFDDPNRAPAVHLSQTTSHPTWLVQRWLDRFGPEQTREVCLAGISRPPLCLRPNPLKLTGADPAAELCQRLQAEGITATPAHGQAVVEEQTGAVLRTQAFGEGLFQPQDPTAMLPVQAMRPQPGQAIIDLCAGLGTKTTQILEALGGQGTVLATDVEVGLLEGLRSNAARLGLEGFRTLALAEIPRAARELERLDWVMIDAPCSNSGVFGRRPEARYRLVPQALGGLAVRQVELLRHAATLARAGTRLLYSTCSILEEENEQVCRAFLEAKPDWRLQASALTLPRAGQTPAEWRDGGYWAVLGHD